MITNTCPFCGSADWDYDERIDDGYEEDECWVDWTCYCYGCKSYFKRLESYKLTEATHRAFEEG